MRRTIPKLARSWTAVLAAVVTALALAATPAAATPPPAPSAAAPYAAAPQAALPPGAVSLPSGYGLNLSTGQVLKMSDPAPFVSGCNAWLCLYNSSATGATPILRFASGYPVGCYDMDSTTDNQTAYVWNTSIYRWVVYLDHHCGGTSGPLYPKNAGPMAGVYYKSISSLTRTNMTS